MSSRLESDVCYRVAPSGENYGGNRRLSGKYWQPTTRWIAYRKNFNIIHTLVQYALQILMGNLWKNVSLAV